MESNRTFAEEFPTIAKVGRELLRMGLATLCALVIVLASIGLDLSTFLTGWFSGGAYVFALHCLGFGEG